MNNLSNQDTLKQACRLKVCEQVWICEKKFVSNHYESTSPLKPATKNI